jgi:hypothetical protein
VRYIKKHNPKNPDNSNIKAPSEKKIKKPATTKTSP